MTTSNTDSAALAYKYGYQAATNDEIKNPPYKDQTKNLAWTSGFNQAVKDFKIK